jgi:hypothetical protein
MLPAAHGLSSALQSWVLSAIADEERSSTIAINAASMERLSILIDFTFAPSAPADPAEIELRIAAPDDPGWKSYIAGSPEYASSTDCILLAWATAQGGHPNTGTKGKNRSAHARKCICKLAPRMAKRTMTRSAWASHANCPG